MPALCARTMCAGPGWRSILAQVGGRPDHPGPGALHSCRSPGRKSSPASTEAAKTADRPQTAILQAGRTAHHRVAQPPKLFSALLDSPRLLAAAVSAQSRGHQCFSALLLFYAEHPANPTACAVAVCVTVSQLTWGLRRNPRSSDRDEPHMKRGKGIPVVQGGERTTRPAAGRLESRPSINPRLRHSTCQQPGRCPAVA